MNKRFDGTDMLPAVKLSQLLRGQRIYDGAPPLYKDHTGYHNENDFLPIIPHIGSAGRLLADPLDG